MKRRLFLTGALAGTVGTVGAAAVGVGAGTDAPDKAPLMTSPLVVMAPREDGVECVFSVSRLCLARIECRDQDGVVTTFATDEYGMVPQGSWVIRVRVGGLKPGGVYQLRAVVEASGGEAAREESPWKTIRTFDPAAVKSRFVVWNDTHENVETLRRLHEITPGADFLLWNGDVCNNWNAESQLIPIVLNPAGQDVTAGRPLVLVWGNHDVRGRWAFRLKDVVATPHGKPYQAFRNGPVACVCLHTGEDKPDNHPSFGGRVALEGLRREQAAWLKQIIREPGIRDAPYKVVFCHIPLRWTKEAETTNFAKGEYDLFARDCRNAWHDSLVEWGAQVVVSGHTHEDAWVPANERFPYAQMVSGGPIPKEARWIEGVADASGLKLVMRDLEGKTVREAVFGKAGS